MKKKVSKSEEEWKKKLTPEQFKVSRMKGTEKPFSGEYHDSKEKGIYQCVCCETDLFHADVKFDSGTGWPSFWEPLSSERVRVELDVSHGMRRMEVLCDACDAHLGHVFDDGPPPTGKRYCINSVSLKLEKQGS